MCRCNVCYGEHCVPAAGRFGDDCVKLWKAKLLERLASGRYHLQQFVYFDDSQPLPDLSKVTPTSVRRLHRRAMSRLLRLRRSVLASGILAGEVTDYTVKSVRQVLSDFYFLALEFPSACNLRKFSYEETKHAFCTILYRVPK